MSQKEVRVLAATGILGSGFKESSLKKGISWRPDFIGADSGSTDPGPHFLGSGEFLFSSDAYRRELPMMIRAGREAGIPVIVGSAGGAGTDGQVDAFVEMVQQIARSESLHFRLGIVRCEQDKDFLVKKLRAGKIKPLVSREFPLDQYAAALNLFVNRQAVGKIVLRVRK